jgi:site-specific DNA-cytosine methylase
MSAQDMTFAEFLAGIGLMRIGLENAGWHIAFANAMRRHLGGVEGWEFN